MSILENTLLSILIKNILNLNIYFEICYREFLIKFILKKF